MVTSILLNITVAMILALAAVRLARKSRAAFRHALIAATFAMLIALPIASVVASQMRVEVPIARAPDFVAPIVDLISETTPIASHPTSSSRSVLQTSPSFEVPSAQTILLVAWMTGVIAFLVPIVIGLGQIRSLRRSGIPWRVGQGVVDTVADELGVRTRVDVLLHERVAGPMTCGVWRPSILLPVDAEKWPAEDLERAIIHELEHVRRWDWASEVAARAICAVYWFHPLVWISQRQLALEAERACDDAVLERAEAAGYADQLVDLAKRLSNAHHQPLLAMANRSDLTRRVRALLDVRQVRGRASVGIVTFVCLIALALVVAMSPLRIVAAVQTLTSSQSSTTFPKFDVVSVKPCGADASPSSPTGGRRGNPAAVSPGRLRIDCQSLFSLIQTAYISFANGRVSQPGSRPDFHSSASLPEWVTKERFTIEAKTDGDPPPAVLRGPMLQSILEDRFKVQVHVETREVPVDELVVAKGGAKLTPFKPGACVPYDYNVYPQPPLEPGQRRCMNNTQRDSDNNWVDTAEATTLDAWVAGMSVHTDRGVPRWVVNKTGLTGRYSFRLVHKADEPGDAPPFEIALKNQLGLELRPSKGPRDFLVIDHVERPTPNDAVFGGPEGPPYVPQTVAPYVPPPGPSVVETQAPQAPSAKPKYDVVSVKPCDSSSIVPGQRGGGGAPNLSPGRVTLNCQSVKGYIQAAYLIFANPEVRARPEVVLTTPIEGGPDWIANERYTINATAPGASTAMMQGPMLQSLLEDRFALKIHWDTREIPVFNLVVGKNGPKMTPFKEGSCVPMGIGPGPGQAPAALAPGERRCTMLGTMKGPNMVIDAEGVTIDQFASFFLFLSSGRVVIDKTGIPGKFNFHLEHAPADDFRRQIADVRGDPGNPTAPEIFTAIQEQLGLKLEDAKGPGKFLVIDHVERPKVN